MKKLFIFTLLLIQSAVLLAQERPLPISPAFSENLLMRSETQLINNGYTEGFATLLDAFTFGGNRLVDMQAWDGGWGWPLDPPNSPNHSPLNTIGPIAMGLAQAYQRTGLSNQRTALINAGTYLLTKTNNFSPSDGYLASQLDKIFNVTTYTEHMTTYFYEPLADETYNRNGLGTLYNTENYVTMLRNYRTGDNANIAAWDVGMGLVSAAMCGASTAEWIDGVKAEINELNGEISYDVIGLAGAVYGLAFVNEDFDPTAGWHAAANNINDLAATLASYQIAGGGFAYNQAHVIPNEENETEQETAYAILALNEVNRTLYLTKIQGAADYLRSIQLSNGGWGIPSQGGENNEVTGEALWGISVVYTPPVNVTQQGIDYDFPTEGVIMNFTTLPVGGGNVTVVRHNQAYTPFPGSYTNLGLWLDITSGMPNYSFNAEVTVDVSAIAGFNASTSVMYYNSSSSKWVAIPGGTYNEIEHTFTFTTNHFTPFTFINTPATAYDIYLSAGTSASAGLIYPNTDWGVTSYEPDDWDFTAPISLYIVPEVGSVFGASDITIQWDNTMFSFDDVDESGGIYDGSTFQFFFSQLGNTDQVTINASRLDNHNFNIISDQYYIAKLNLNLLKPGFGPVNFTALDFRAFDGNGGQSGVYVTGNNAAVKSYLGDVASSSVTTTGDGLVDINDLNLWAGSYWSGVGPNNLDNYKVKYDVGPTTDNTVYGLPVPDQKIQFEDLVIFSMSYGLSADHVYPKISVPAEPVELQLGKPVISGNQTRIPLFVSGGVVNLRAMSLIFGGQFGKLVSVEKGAILNQFTNPVMLMNKTEDGQVYVDLAVMGAYETGICSEGEVLTLVFEGNAALNISSADLRNMLNKPMEINISAGKEVVPSEYALLQNYPNPFNPTTMINFDLPQQSQVEISIFNSLGEKVAVLMSETKEAGRHHVEFNASGFSSGIYFYQIKANDYVSVKKMILMK